jgi:ribosomal protein S18 acetylase RimI-like enzyme
MEIKVYSSEESVSVMVVDGHKSIACADMDFMENYWYLCRLKVTPENQRQGWGRRMIEELKKHTNGLPIVVQPGGYAETSM